MCGALRLFRELGISPSLTVTAQVNSAGTRPRASEVRQPSIPKDRYGTWGPKRVLRSLRDASCHSLPSALHVLCDDNEKQTEAGWEVAPALARALEKRG